MLLVKPMSHYQLYMKCILWDRKNPVIPNYKVLLGCYMMSFHILHYWEKYS